MKRTTLALLLAGCAAAPTFPEPSAQWETFTGQLQYVTPGRSLIGEFSVAQHGGDFRLEFSKGGAVPLIKVQRSGALAQAEGPLARGRWRGEAAQAPAQMRGWVEEVPRALGRIEPGLHRARTATSPPVTVDRGRPRRIEVPGAQAGEKFVFILTH